MRVKICRVQREVKALKKSRLQQVGVDSVQDGRESGLVASLVLESEGERVAWPVL